jgi:glycosyltransferase involved in cell wall biosynthesis
MDRREDYNFINLLKFLGFTVVYTAHDLFPNTNASPDDHNLLERIYQKVDAIIVHGNTNKNEIVNKFNLSRDNVHVIPHGSNDLFYRGKNIPKAAAKTQLGISPSQRVILFFGVIKRYKGLEYLVDAFEEVSEQVDNAILLVVGKIYDADAEGFRYYSALINQIRKRDDVICVPRYIPFDKIGLYFTAADVVVLPYDKTYTSGVLLAAYAAGRPVVVTDTGELSEVVESGKSGFVVPPRNSKALTQAIIEILASSKLEEMGKYARHLAETKYSWQSVASRTTDLYQALMT